MPYKDPSAAAAAKKKHYEANKSQAIERAKARREAIKDEIRAIKNSTPCVDCGVQYPYYVMHFDHLGIEEKVERVSQLLRSRGYDIIMAELPKCEVVCANCHAARTWERMQ